MVSLNQNSVGVDFEKVEATPTFKTGTVVRGSDAHDWIYAQASGAIADDTVCALTEPAMTMATGAGDWTNRNGALTSGQYTWFQKTAA